MRRRDFLSAASSFSLALALGAQSLPVGGPSRKKGLGISTKKGAAWLERIQALKPAWVYTWGSARPEGLPPEVAFAPMVWGYWGQDETIAKLGDFAKVKEEPADYSKALTDFASAQAEIAAENMAAFAEVAKKVQMDTVELMMAAGKSATEEASAAVKKATAEVTAAAKKAATAAA